MSKGGKLSYEGKAGFTLLEVIIATTIGAMLLVASLGFIFSMSELWGSGNESRLYRKHARSVSRFLEKSFYEARYFFDASQGSYEPVSALEWSPRGGGDEEYLTFELMESPGLLVWPEKPLPYVVCSLEFVRGEGLYLLWRSRLEEDFGKKDPRRMLISPFVAELLYHYKEEGALSEEWEIVDLPKDAEDGERSVPERIELVFDYKGERISRHIAIPGQYKGLPLL